MPKLVRKNSKAAAAEAAAEAVKAAKAEEIALKEKIDELAAEYKAMGGGAGTEALAQAAEPGDPLRERWHAFHLVKESKRRAEILSGRKAIAAETAATEAAVARHRGRGGRCFESRRRRTQGCRRRRCCGKRAARP